MASVEEPCCIQPKSQKRPREGNGDSDFKLAQYFFFVLDLVEEAIMLLDTDTSEILYVNRSLERLLGMKRRDLSFNPIPSSIFWNGESDMQNFLQSAKQATLLSFSPKHEMQDDSDSPFFIEKEFQLLDDSNSQSPESKPTRVSFYSSWSLSRDEASRSYFGHDYNLHNSDVCCIFKTKKELSTNSANCQVQGTEVLHHCKADDFSQTDFSKLELSTTVKSIISSSSPDQELSTIEFMNYFKVFSEYGGCWYVVEYLPEVNDTRVVWLNTCALNQFRPFSMNPSQLTETSCLLGKMFKRDLKFLPHQVDIWIERYKSLIAIAEATSTQDLVKVDRVYDDIVQYPNGEIRHLIIHYYIVDAKLMEVQNALQHPYRICTVLEDITEVKLRLEKETKISSELAELCTVLKTLLDTAPILMGVVELVDNDTDVIFLFHNPMTATILKFPSDANLTRRRISELGIPKEVLAFWIQKYRESERLGTPVQFELNSYSEKDDHWGLACVMHITKDRFIFISQDITHLRKLEAAMIRHGEELAEKIKERTKQLEDALEVKGRFLATMSHEVRTPLTGIIGSIELLAETPMNQDQRDLVNIIKVCGEQVQTVSPLLTCSL